MRIVVTVISDLSTDQRVHRVCETLRASGHDVRLIGAARRGSAPLEPRSYRAGRIRQWFGSGPLRFVEFNLRLFFRLLFVPADAFLGNDLDVMAATFAAARLRRKPVVYDSHEYFLGMTGLEGKRLRKSLWALLERRVVPRVDAMYTVTDTIAAHYTRRYRRPVAVVRNLPVLTDEPPGALPRGLDPGAWAGKALLLYQGAGINERRGVEELVAAMAQLDPAKFHLLIVGDGERLAAIRREAKDRALDDRITFFPKVPWRELAAITKLAAAGFSLDKPENENQRIGLPNKVLEYLHAGVPVVMSRLPEQAKILKRFDVGCFIENHDPAHIASVVRDLFADPERLANYRKNTIAARQALNWQSESQIVRAIFEQLPPGRVN